MHNKTAAIAERLADLQQRSRATDDAAAATLQQLLLQGQQLADAMDSEAISGPLGARSPPLHKGQQRTGLGWGAWLDQTAPGRRGRGPPRAWHPRPRPAAQCSSAMGSARG